MNGRRLLVSCGEVSGDRLAVRTVCGLRAQGRELEVAGCGGAALAEAGGDLFLHRERISFVGWSAPLLHLWRLWNDLRRFLARAEAWNPDAVLLVDAPGWNRRVLAWSRRRGLPVHWLAPPQLWAWNGRRASYLEGVSVQPLFAFETLHLERWGARVAWCGFPRDPVAPSRSDGTLALLPGSRPGLWRRNLPVFAQAARRLGSPVAVAVPGVADPHLERECRRLGLSCEASDVLMARASLCLAVPGTGSLESVRCGIPTVVAALPGRLDAFLARRCLDPGPKALANRILGVPLVEELFLGDASPQALVRALADARGRRDEFSKAAERLEETLGPGDARALEWF